VSPQPPHTADVSVRPRPGEFVRRNIRPALAAMGATVLVQMSVYVAAGAALPEPAASAAALMASLVWLLLAAPIFAAGGRSMVDGMVRGGCVADGGLVVLIAVGCGEALGFWGVVKVYVIWLAVALAASAAVQQARRVRARHVAAAAVVAVLLALAAGPFWANWIILAADPPWRGRLSSAVAAASGVYATVGCMENVGFVWTQCPILYQHTVLSRDVQFAPPPWQATAAGFAALAALLIARAVLARRPAG
jgi:hypothetical protein